MEGCWVLDGLHVALQCVRSLHIWDLSIYLQPPQAGGNDLICSHLPQELTMFVVMFGGNTLLLASFAWSYLTMAGLCGFVPIINSYSCLEAIELVEVMSTRSALRDGMST